MNQKIIVRLFVLVNLLAINFAGPFGFTTVDVVYAQAEIPFLITPYYGKTSITALFDHQLPGYTGEQGDNWIVTFLGRLRSNPDPNVCTGGINGDCYDGHNGVDFGLSYKQILVAVDGLVTKAQWDEVDRFANYGLVVEIEHTINNVKYRTRYGHLSTIAVYTGQTVAAGKILGSSGHTGLSTGPHLHFDIHQWDAEEEKWVPIDPFGWEPETGAEVNVDPWASHMKSWCMWSDGEWANYCNRSSRPIPQPLNGVEFIVNDTTDNTSGFSKGYGDFWNNTCTGKDPTCRHWYEANQGLGSHTYHTIANGNTTIDNWAKWQPPLAPLVGVNFSEIYEIFVYIPTISAYSNDTFTWQAKFKVKDAAGQIREVIVDEYSGRDRWLSIGMYYMDAYSYVYVTDATGEAQNTHCPSGPNGWCRMTADAVKFVRRGVAHLSDVRTTNGDTESLVVISNNGGGTASVKVSPFNSTGSYAGYYAFSVGKGNQVVLSMSNGGIATARVSANQDVVVVVENQLSTGGDWAYNGVATSDPLNPGWGQTGTTIYAPVNMNNYWTWYSNLYLYNTSTSHTNVDLVATNDEGGTISINDEYVPANNQLLYAPFVVQNELYAAKITNDANAPLSAVVVQNSENIYETYNAFSSGATKFYAPLIMSNYYYWNTSVNIQNISASTATVTIKYYRDTGSTPVRTNTINIPKDQTRSLYSPDEGLPDLDPNRPGVNFIGSATITSNQNVVVVINQSMSGAGRGLSYSAVSSGKNYVVLPDLLYHVNDLKPGGTSNENWMTSVNILNLEDHSTQVFLNFDQYCWINRTLDKYGSVSWMLDGCGPDSHRGPGIVYTNDGSKIAVVVNHSSANYSNDLAHSYTGVNR